MNRAIFLRPAVAVAATLALASCSHIGLGDSSMTETYTATLTPRDEVPPAADSQGRGTAVVHVDSKASEITYKVSWSGLTGPATAGHIHGPATPGNNAGVAVPFPGVAGQSSVEGKAKITPAQYRALASGTWYVNIHTAKHPGGEIRGQLTRQ
jgi:hypothetical protein